MIEELIKGLFLMGIGLFLTLPSVNAGAADLQVAKGVITTEVVERSPTDIVSSVPSTVGKLYFFTRVEGAEGKTTVTHVWTWNEMEMARIDLPVRSTNWRTFSSKVFLPEWKGQWQVNILGEYLRC